MVGLAFDKTARRRRHRRSILPMLLMREKGHINFNENTWECFEMQSSEFDGKSVKDVD